MEYLAKQMETSSDVNEFCHGLTHNIGHDAYDKYGFSAAMQQGDDTCGSGYFHGVIEKHFVNDAAVLKTFKTICKPNDGRCFHGIGHGLMFANKIMYQLPLLYVTHLKPMHKKYNAAKVYLWSILIRM